MKKILLFFTLIVAVFLTACTGRSSSSSSSSSASVTLDRIAVTTEISDKEYNIGEELDLSGGKITIYYSDGTSLQTAITQSMVSGFDSQTSGTKTVTVSYEEYGVTKTTTFTVTVNATLSSIAVKTQPTKVSYIEGETFDATGLVVEAVYSDSTRTPITTYTLDKTVLALGDNKVTVTYEGLTAQIDITVVAKSVTSIEITTQPTKVAYSEGETFDATGMVVTAHYNNNTSEVVTGYTVDKTTLAATDTLVTVTYEGKTATVAITVESKGIVGIEVTTMPTKQAYNEGELFNPTGMVISVVYSDSTTEVVPSNEYMIHSSTGLTKETASIKITYGGYETTVTVRMFEADATPEQVEEMRRAISEVAYAYLYNKTQINYDQYQGLRLTFSAPEAATAHMDSYLDCSSFLISSYYEAFGFALVEPHSTKGFEAYAFENYGKNDEVLYYEKTINYKTEAERIAILNEVRAALQPGDLINYRHGPRDDISVLRGHVMMYVGNDTFLHSRGTSYVYNEKNPYASYDKKNDSEAKYGSVQTLDADMIFDPANKNNTRYLFYTTSNDTTWSFSLIRPLNKPGMYEKLTESAKARIATPGLHIEKSADPAHMLTVTAGEEITYTTYVKNESKEAWTNLNVTDVISEHATYVAGSISHDGIVNGSNITWTIPTVAAGESIKLTYTVKVNDNAPIGARIDSSLGRVANVKTNEIFHTVGSITKKHEVKLSMAATNEIGNTYSDDLAFVESVYQSSLGINVTDLTSVEAVLTDMLDPEKGLYKPESEMIKMMAPNLYNGYNFMWKTFDKDLSKVRLIRPTYLETGDIIVLEDQTKTGADQFKAFLYRNNSSILTLENGVVVEKFATSSEVTSFLGALIAFRQFAVLRPGLVATPTTSGDETIAATIGQLKDIGVGDITVSLEARIIGYVQDTNSGATEIGKKLTNRGLLVMDPADQSIISLHGFTVSENTYHTENGAKYSTTDTAPVEMNVGDLISIKDVKFNTSSEGAVYGSTSTAAGRSVLMIQEDSEITIKAKGQASDAVVTQNITTITNWTEMKNAFKNADFYDVFKIVASEENPLYVGQTSSTLPANGSLHYDGTASGSGGTVNMTIYGASRGVAISKYDPFIPDFPFKASASNRKIRISYTSGEVYIVVGQITPSYAVCSVVNTTTLGGQVIK